MDSIQSPKLSANHNTLVADSLNLDSFLHFWQSDTSSTRFPLGVVNFWFSASLSVSTRPPVTTLEQRGDSGWMRVVFLNMTDPSCICPSGLKLTSRSRRKLTSHSRRKCGWAGFAQLLVYYIQCAWFVIQSSMWQGTGGVEILSTIQDTKALTVPMWMVCHWLLELPVHISTSGHLLVACSQAMVAVALIQIFDIHVILGTPTLTSFWGQWPVLWGYFNSQ